MTACEGLIPSDCNNPDCPAHTADRDDLAAILNAHLLLGFGCCQCGWLAENRFVVPTDQIQTQHRAHVAQMVLQSDWLAAVKAEAFKRGWIDSAVHHATCHECGTGPLRHDIPDPYRVDRVDAEDTDNTTDRT